MNESTAADAPEIVRRNMCANCWLKQRPLVYSHTLTPPVTPDTCHFCGQRNRDGYYVSYAATHRDNGES